MGSAAPPQRRWLLASLVLLAGVSVAALVVGAVIGLRSSAETGGDDLPPALGSESEAGPAGPAAATVTVGLESGWTVPALAEGHEDGHGDDREGETGRETVGATQMVAPGATMMIVHGSGPLDLAYRTVADDRRGPWQRLSTEADEGPDGLVGDEGHDTTMPAAGPTWLGSGIDEVEFVLLAGDSTGFDLTFLGSSGIEPDLTPAGAVVGQGPSLATAPPVIRREQWATGEWDYQKEACDAGPSIADHTQAVVIHHTVTTNSYGEEDVDDLLRAIYYSHVVVNGWCDIGYNFVVDRFGRIWEARTGSIDNPVIGGHARGFNTSTVGVALLGQHHPGSRPAAAAPSAAAEAAVEALAHWKLEIGGVDPAGRTWLRNRSSREPLRLAGQAWHHVPTILAHRDLGVTSCPGGHAMDLVRNLPASLAAARDLTLPYSFVDWRGHSHGPGFVVADRVGGIRPAGAATPWSQAPAGLTDRSAIAVGGNLAGGYLLADSGDVVGFGTAPDIAERPAGDVVPVDLVVRSDGQSGWVLDQQGTFHGFGGAVDLANGPVTAPVAGSLDDAGSGYAVGADGGLRSIGGSPPAVLAENSEVGGTGAKAIDLTLRSDGVGGWVLDDRGRIHGFGGAPSTRVEPPAAVRAITASATGPGGWVLDAEGQLWPFGGARLIFPVSTDASAGNAVDLDHVGAVYSPAFLNGGDARFITSVHQLFLGREPSVVEIDHEVTDLEQGDRRLDLTSELARSEHWSGDTIDEMYRNALGREPDADGRSYWLAQVANGLRLQDLGIYFYGSSEYADRAGSPEAYVTGLYDVLLSRAPDAEGLTYWVGLLQQGQADPPDVANGFYASVESRRDRADRLHRRVLGAPAPVEDREAWADRLQSVGDAGVAAEMAASSAYYRLVVDGPEP